MDQKDSSYHAICRNVPSQHGIPNLPSLILTLPNLAWGMLNTWVKLPWQWGWNKRYNAPSDKHSDIVAERVCPWLLFKFLHFFKKKWWFQCPGVADECMKKDQENEQERIIPRRITRNVAKQDVLAPRK